MNQERAVAATRDQLDRLRAAATPRIVVIVLTWNSRRYVNKCLDSVSSSTIPVATLVIDNASSDDTALQIESRQDSSAVVLETGLNLGYAGGNNIGLRVAIDAGADIGVLLNPDATLAPDCIERLVGLLDSSNDVGLVSPAICYSETDTVWYAGSDVNLMSGAANHLFEGTQWSGLPKDPFTTGRGNGCVLGIRLTSIHEVGFLDERYFLYYEETDLSMRMRALGFKSMVVPKARAWHDVGHGAGVTKSPIHHYYMTRNRLLFASQYCLRGAFGALPFSFKDSIVSLWGDLWSDPASFPQCANAVLMAYRDFTFRRFGARFSPRITKSGPEF